MERKNGQMYLTFKTKDSSKEMSVPAALGVMFLYEFFCVANSGGTSDLMFTTMSQNDWKDYLHSMKSTLSVLFIVNVNVIGSCLFLRCGCFSSSCLF